MKYLGEILGVILVICFVVFASKPEYAGEFVGRFVHGFQSAMTPVEPVNPAFAPERVDQ